MIHVKNRFYELYYRIKKKGKLWKEITRQQNVQMLPRKEIEKMQLESLKELVKHAYDSSEFYKKIWDKAGFNPAMITDLSDIQNIPYVTKDDLRSAGRNIVASSTIDRKRLKKDKTSGSTNRPFAFFKDRDDAIAETAARLLQYLTAGYPLGERRVIFRGEPDSEQIINKSYQSMQFISCFGMNDEKIGNIIRDFKKASPYLIESYPSTLVTVSQYLKKKDETISVPSVITAGEMLTDPMRQLIEDRLQTEVFDSYGAAEAMYVAIECEKHEGLHIEPTRFIIEVIDKDGKQTENVGDIVITHLGNHAMPFIRYKIGDRGKIRKGPCTCGRNTPLLESIEGRSVDQLKTSEGKILDFPFFATLFDKHTETIDTFKIIQHQDDLLEIQIVLKKTESKAPLDKIKKKVQEYTGKKTKIKITIMDEIPLGRTGKRIFIESKK